MGIALILSGFMIENVNETLYPWATSLLLIYMMFGYFVLKRKGIKPKLSRAIQAGEVDELWALKFWYWACWWPAFLRGK